MKYAQPRQSASYVNMDGQALIAQQHVILTTVMFVPAVGHVQNVHLGISQTVLTLIVQMIVLQLQIAHNVTTENAQR